MKRNKQTDVPEIEYSSKYAAYRKKRDDEQKPENAKGTVLRFLSLIKPHAFSMGVVVFCAMASTVCNIVAPQFMSDVINVMQDSIANRVNTGAEIGFAAARTPLINLVLVYGLASVFSFIQEFVSAGVSQKLVCSLRAQLNGKLSRLPLRFFDRYTKGEVISKMINDIDNVSSSLQSSILTVMTNAIQVVGSLVMMLLTKNIWMTLAAIVLVPISGTISYLVSKKSKVWFRRYWDTMGDLNGHIEEMYAGHTVVRIFGHEKESVEEFHDITVRLGKNSFMANMISGVLNPVLTLIKNINYVSLCLLGGYFFIQVNTGALTSAFGIGDITKFLSYSSYFSNPIINLSRIVNSIQSSLASAERVFSLMDEEEESPDDTTNEDAPVRAGRIEFRDVSFRYKEDVPLIDDLDLVAEAGSTTAIVGPTGAGKTTIVNLLMRFYDIRSGTIRVDGRDTAELSRAEDRNLFAMVLQDTWLFKGTVAENVAYGCPDATREEIERACDFAYCDHFIRRLPQGYDTVISEDSTAVSSGQKQLLTIARALLADRPLLILDEATSNVDTRTELLIQKAMDRLMGGRTCFVIAHRLSTIVDADLILVLRDGQIVEQGTHKSLLEQKGFYWELYQSQYAV